MATRIKGQDTLLEVYADNVAIIQAHSPIRSFEVTFKQQKLEEQYLGDPSMRYDEIFQGVDFNMEMHFENENVLKFVELIRNRATGQSAATKAVVNIRTTLQFSGGNKQNIVLTDCYFENIPMNFADRSSYGTVTLTGSCSNFDRLT